jgi:5'-nucleotidase
MALSTTRSLITLALALGVALLSAGPASPTRAGEPARSAALSADRGDATAPGGGAISMIAPASQGRCPVGGARGKGQTVGLQLLAINDFHGALEPRAVAGRPAGGAATLAAYLDRAEEEARAEGAPTLRVGAGDLIGASPPISALVQDEPTIEALGLAGLRFSSVGNHEFDEGPAELRRLQEGGCHPETGCFAGASFRYLAANVVDATTGQPVFSPYAIETVRGIPVAFIGAVLEATPTIVTPAGVAGLRFLDEAETVNRYVAELTAQGVEAIVVLIHQGGSGTVDGGPIAGPIVPIVEAIDGEVDVVVSGHTHQGYQGTIDGKLVTQAFANGTAFADVDLDLDCRTGDVAGKRARIVTAFADVPPGTVPNPDIAALVARAAERVAPIVNRVVATAEADLTRTPNEAGESALGSLIADAQRRKMGTQLAFTNLGGIREDIPAGPVTFGQLFAVQPFGNDLVKLELTGSQVERLLEQQWAGQDRPRILQVSGLSYRWDPTGPVGDRVAPEEVSIGGQPLDPNAAYTVALNGYLADGGDGFSVLLEGVDRVVGPVDLDALVEYLEQASQPFNAAVEGRIRTRDAD